MFDNGVLAATSIWMRIFRRSRLLIVAIEKVFMCVKGGRSMRCQSATEKDECAHGLRLNLFLLYCYGTGLKTIHLSVSS